MAACEEDTATADAETSFEVHLYIYDLSKELSKSFKKILKGKPLPEVWHTSLVTYGREYYFCSSGIESCRPGETILGEPDQILTLGKTELPYSVFLEYIFALGESSYQPGSYHLLEHNCNVFSQEVSNFLTGRPIPQELRELSNDILGNKSLSNTLKEYFDKLCLRAEGSKGISFGAVVKPKGRRRSSADQSIPSTSNGEVIVNGHHNSSKNNKNHSKKEAQPDSEAAGQKKNNMPSVNGTSSSTKDSHHPPNIPESASESPESPVDVPASKPSNPEPVPQDSVQQTDSTETNQNAATNRNVENSNLSTDDDTPLPTFTSRRSRKYSDPAILYPKVDGVSSYNKVLTVIGEKLCPEEKHAMNEILEYLNSPDGGAWALGSPHLDVLGRLLNDRNFPEEVHIETLRVMEAAALKEDVILLLHQDRDHHHIMSYLHKIENLPDEEQEHVATFLCNLCCNSSSFDWLMYISEWMEEDGRSCNNSKVTVKVAVHALLAEKQSIHDKGSALLFNLALKELFDDVATELAMAVLQFLQSNLSEEFAFRGLIALYRFMCISYNDVPALMKMLGPDVRKFIGLSERVDSLVEQIHTKISVAGGM